MTMRKTPFARIRYPWASDTVNVADVQSMASDVDQALVNTANLAGMFSRMSSVTVQRAAAQSITKSTNTAISFDTVVLDNGTDSPVANGAWYNAAVPTRLTAPAPCVVLASGLIPLNLTAAFGTTGCIQAAIALNGVSSGPNMQGSKWGPTSTDTGYQAASALSMWKLSTGDYLELKVFWTGTPAGPLSTVASFGNVPTFSLAMIALPSVP